MPAWIIRFTRFTIVGVSVFAIDFFSLWFLIDVVQIHYLLATAVAFSIATSINYFFARKWVFKYSERGKFVGYLFYLKLSLVGITLTLFLMWFITENTNLHVLLTRIIIGGFVGILNYLGNLFLNFKVAGKSLD